MTTTQSAVVTAASQLGLLFMTSLICYNIYLAIRDAYWQWKDDRECRTRKERQDLISRILGGE